MANRKRQNGGPADRLVEGLAEQRVDLGLSRRQLGELAGCSGETVRNVEQGRARNPQTVTQLRTALAMVELYGTAKPEPVPDWAPPLLPFELEIGVAS